MITKMSAVGVVSMVVASQAVADGAVQWRVEDGGNGHWYNVTPQSLRWSDADVAANDVGGHLASITSSSENAFIAQLWTRVESTVYGAWAGGRRTNTGCGPDCGWSWSSGESWGYTNWWTGEPNDTDGHETCLEIFVYQALNAWNDAPESTDYRRRSVVEWDADCNGDGIVDYGQCHDGTLPDYNGDNIPDCCERGEVCIIGSYPVQWRIEDGGNGHWYQLSVSTRELTWFEARDVANSEGAYLATATSASEAKLIGGLAVLPRAWSQGGYIGPWLGGYQDHGAVDYAEPSGGWRWVTNEPWSFTAWDPIGNQPSNGPLPGEDFLHLSSYSWTWNDLRCCDGGVVASIIEWSADCNQDNIVDYGQILSGQLADANVNGTPDICEGPTCRDVDLFRDGAVNGADLGILLAQWGVANANTVSDINNDGRVDGSDLGTLLAFWGPCPK